MGGAQIQIGQQQGHAAMDQALSELVHRLSEIEAQLRSPAPNKGTLKQLADSVFAERWGAWSHKRRASGPA